MKASSKPKDNLSGAEMRALWDLHTSADHMVLSDGCSKCQLQPEEFGSFRGQDPTYRGLHTEVIMF